MTTTTTSSLLGPSSNLPVRQVRPKDNLNKAELVKIALGIPEKMEELKELFLDTRLSGATDNHNELMATKNKMSQIILENEQLRAEVASLSLMVRELINNRNKVEKEFASLKIENSRINSELSTLNTVVADLTEFKDKHEVFISKLSGLVKM